MFNNFPKASQAGTPYFISRWQFVEPLRESQPGVYWCTFVVYPVFCFCLFIIFLLHSFCQCLSFVQSFHWNITTYTTVNHYKSCFILQNRNLSLQMLSNTFGKLSYLIKIYSGVIHYVNWINSLLFVESILTSNESARFSDTCIINDDVAGKKSARFTNWKKTYIN